MTTTIRASKTTPPREGATPQAPSSSDHVVKDFTRKLAEEDGRGGRI